MADPTPYDILQDNQISALQDIVTPYYQPPGEQEYSFPVVGQGVSSEMHQQISRAAGTGVYVQGDEETAQSPYRLAGMPGGDSETNATNQMRLRVPTNTGRSEAAMSGFFHTQTQDMTLSFPAVSTPTTYRVCLTYDPRREEEDAGPIRVEVHPGPPPTTHGRTHIVLWTVHREPNQLLTDATITQTRPWLGHVINVWSYDQLPDPTTTELGVLAVVLYREGTTGTDPVLYTNRGVHGWVKVYEKPTKYTINLLNGWEVYSSFGLFQATLKDGWVTFQGVIRNGAWTESRFANLPEPLHPRRNRLIYGFNTYSGTLIDVRVAQNGDMTFGNPTGTRPTWITFDGVSYPLD